MPKSIEQAISAATGKAFRIESQRSVAGGCISEALCIRGAGQDYFLKLNAADQLPMFQAEAAGLAAIRASGSVRAPQAISWGVEGNKSWLALEFITFGTPQANSSALLGEQLAMMHRNTADAFGWEQDNTIGATPQANDWNKSWVDFLREKRLGFQLDLASHNGAPAKLIQDGRKLLAVLDAFFDGYQLAPSLLHGDLWGGNWAADGNGNPVIFDPATFFGDRESDLAMTELFGGFDSSFYQAYASAWPLHPGYGERKRLYQLYHILNHFNLFGGAYATQAQGLVDHLLMSAMDI